MNPLLVARISFAIACVSGLALATMHFGVTGVLAAILVIALVSFVLAFHEL